MNDSTCQEGLFKCITTPSTRSPLSDPALPSERETPWTMAVIIGPCLVAHGLSGFWCSISAMLPCLPPTAAYCSASFQSLLTNCMQEEFLVMPERKQAGQLAVRQHQKGPLRTVHQQAMAIRIDPATLARLPIRISRLITPAGASAIPPSTCWCWPALPKKRKTT